METIAEVRTAAGRSYPVLSGQGAAAALAKCWRPGWRQAAVIGDSNTAPRFAPALVRALEPLTDLVLPLTFPAGEAHKTRATKQALEDELLAAGLDRSCCLVAVGGGIVLDLAGFVAATYLRGVAHVSIATSLVAQVDAAVGGKTGVNTPHGKNLVGAFHAPHAALLDLDALASLPPREIRNGLAEAVKHGVVADAELLSALEQHAGSGAITPPAAIITRSVQLKAAIVQADETERGRRRVLNFGHTVGHAVEAATSHAVSHGEAVALGMVVEARVAARLCGFPAAAQARLTTLLERLGLPTAPPISFAAAQPFLGRDKKRARSELRLSLPQDLGCMDEAGGAYATVVPEAELQRAWDAAGRPGQGAGPCSA